MKESGIETLIELLNEYENKDFELEEGEESNARTENNGHLRFNGANKVQFDTYMFDSLALSKRYGFIQWLVENEKIDVDKCDVIHDIYNEELPKKYTRYDAVLMGLAIQDNPIEFLVSILK